MAYFRLLSCLKLFKVVCVIVLLIITIQYLVELYGKNNSLENNVDNFPIRDRSGNRNFYFPSDFTIVYGIQEPVNEKYVEFKPNEEKLGIDEVLNKEKSFNSVVFKASTKNLRHKIVHLDLKGAPPKISYLVGLLPLLQVAGATGLLIEYEDMFPYQGDIEMIKARNAYKKDELIMFLEAAKKFDMEVIPLVQTFGHMEFVLKLSKFRNLRERDKYPDSICPSNSHSMEVIQLMLQQVISLHTLVEPPKWIHIGCDEVYHINECDKCIAKNSSSKKIFVNHIKHVVDYIKNYPNLEILVWDDMFRSFTPLELKSCGLGNLVQPVVWIYSTSIVKLVPDRIWYLYTTVFDKIWIASAFKGASGAIQTIPDTKLHYENHLAWMDFTSTFKIPGTNKDYIFQGIFLTGWSRYMHFAVLCETLPVAVPSLILNLLLINMHLEQKNVLHISKRSQNGINTLVYQNWLRLLQCPHSKEFKILVSKINHNHLTKTEGLLHLCQFRGNSMYGNLRRLAMVENNVLDFYFHYTYKVNGLYEYNVNHNTVDLFVHSNTREKAKALEKTINLMSKYIEKDLNNYFDNDTIEEFVELKITPIKRIVQKAINLTRESTDSNRVWDTRPYKAVLT